MNFYIGDSIDKIKGDEYNVELNDDLLEYLYILKSRIPFVSLYDINPYNDIEVREDGIYDIIDMCKYILNNQLLKNYEDETNAILVLNSLIKIGEKAINEKKKLISVGD